MVSTATAAQTLEPEAFNQLVLERGLKTWEQAGWQYAGYQGPNGWELVRTFIGWDRVTITTTSTANPAAGAQIASITTPTGKLRRYLGISYTVTTDANVANRAATAQFRPDGTNTTMVSACNTAITASITTLRVAFSVQSSAGGIMMSSGALSAELPDVPMPAGSILLLYLYNIQAGDDMGAASYSYQEVDA